MPKLVPPGYILAIFDPIFWEVVPPLQSLSTFHPNNAKVGPPAEVCFPNFAQVRPSAEVCPILFDEDIPLFIINQATLE